MIFGSGITQLQVGQTILQMFSIHVSETKRFVMCRLALPWDLQMIFKVRLFVNHKYFEVVAIKEYWCEIYSFTSTFIA